MQLAGVLWPLLFATNSIIPLMFPLGAGEESCLSLVCRVVGAEGAEDGVLIS